MLQIKDEETPRGLTSRLLLRQTRREDTAVFVCKAENRFGASQRVVHLVVQESSNQFSRATIWALNMGNKQQRKFLHVQEVPEVPQRLTVAGFTSRTANLTWRHPFDGKSEIISFHIEYKKAHRE